jgi:hypothetical protein
MSTDAGSAWPPAPSGECLTCGHAVTPRFERVFGGNDDRVHGCPNCTDRTALQGGATGGDR